MYSKIYIPLYITLCDICKTRAVENNNSQSDIFVNGSIRIWSATDVEALLALYLVEYLKVA